MTGIQQQPDAVTARLVVLGSCGAWPEPGRACSGYLLELGGFRVVLDLGYGTLPRLLAGLGSATAEGLDAVVITHRHADHALDLHGLFRARWLGGRAEPQLALYSPRDVLEQLIGLDTDPAQAIRQVFDWHPLPSADGYRLGPAHLASRPLPHSVVNAGVRITAPGLTIAYTGDTGPDPALSELGRDADLYIVEATDRYQRTGPPTTDPGPAHLTGRLAGAAATEARAKRLLLTHFWPGTDRSVTRAAAAAAFPGEVIVADEGLELMLP